VLNLPKPVNKKPWSEHTKALEENIKDVLEESLSKAALEVKKVKCDSGEAENEEDDDEGLKKKSSIVVCH